MSCGCRDASCDRTIQEQAELRVQELQPIIKTNVEPIVHTRVRPIVNRIVQPIIHRTVRPIINKEVRPVRTEHLVKNIVEPRPTCPCAAAPVLVAAAPASCGCF